MDKKIFFTGIAIFAVIVFAVASIFLIIRSNQPKIDDDVSPMVTISSPDTDELSAYTAVDFLASVKDVAAGYSAVCTWELYFQSEEGRELYVIDTSPVENETCSLRSDGIFKEGELYVSLMVEEVDLKTKGADSFTYSNKSYTVK